LVPWHGRNCAHGYRADYGCVLQNKKIMIKFKVNEGHLRVEIETNIDNKYIFLDWKTGDGLYSELLRRQLNNNMNKNLERIREEAYEQGWKDAKAKVKKKDWFYGWWK
jgi:hypothetical protein